MPYQLVQMMPNGTVAPDLDTWSQEILDDLLQILPAPERGLNNYYCCETILPNLVNLCQISYDIRLGLAEEDICGNIQLLVYPSDTQFQEDEMNTVGTPPEVLDLESDQMGDIAGTVGLGLRECTVNRTSQGTSELLYKTLLAPDVILTRHVLASLKSDVSDNSTADKNNPFSVSAIQDIPWTNNPFSASALQDNPWM